MILSVLLWTMTWKRITGLWSVSWRAYVTAFFTAGVPMSSSGSDYYLLIWTIAFGEKSHQLEIFVSSLLSIAIYWLI